MATAAIAVVAGGDPGTTARVGLSMLCIQVSIGAVNDLADVEVDRVGKPAKPIPAGLVSSSVARAFAVGSVAASVLLALPSGLPTVVVGLGCLLLGYLYDLRLSRTVLSWLPLALALPLLPIFAWVGATGGVPGGLLGLVPVAMLAGGALLVGNGVVDVERDEVAGKATLAVRVGRRAAWRLHAGALVLAVIVALLLAPAPATASAAAGASWLPVARSIGVPLGALAIVAGIGMVGAARPDMRERGWELEAIGTGIVGLGWLAGLAMELGQSAGS